MDRDEIDKLVNGRVIGGTPACKKDSAEWISTFLASLADHEELLVLDWFVLLPSPNSTPTQLTFSPSSVDENKPTWFITLNGEKMEEDKFIRTFKDKLSLFYDTNEKVPSKDNIDPEEIVHHILGGNTGCKYEAADWISNFLENENGYGKLLDTNWNVVIPSAFSTAEPLFFYGEQEKWFFTMNEKKMDEKDRFIQTFSHELAHCYYGDHQQVTPIPPGIDTNHWNSIFELRADLKVEEWGALKIKDDTYLYGKDYGLNWESDWKSECGKSISRNESLSFAKMKNNADILTEYKRKYP